MHKYEIIIYWSNDDQVFVAEVPEFAGLQCARRFTGCCFSEYQRCSDALGRDGAGVWHSDSGTQGRTFDVGVMWAGLKPAPTGRVGCD